MATIYVQQIFDTELNQYVRYESTIPTSEPSPSITTPTSSGEYDEDTHEIIRSYEDFTPSSGGGGKSQTDFIVGFEAAGDTLANCNYLDTGNGAAFAAACQDAYTEDGQNIVLLRPGAIDFNLPGAPTTVDIGFCRVIGSGNNITFRSQGEVLHINLSHGSIKDVYFNAPIPVDYITAEQFACYVMSFFSEIEDCVFYASGGDYGLDEAFWQGGRAMVGMFFSGAIRRPAFFQMPPVGTILESYVDVFETVHVYAGEGP